MNGANPSYNDWLADIRKEAIERGGKPIRPERQRRASLPKGTLTVPALARQMGISTASLWGRLEVMEWAGKAVGWRNRRLYSQLADSPFLDPEWCNAEKWGPIYFDTYRLTRGAVQGGFGIVVPVAAFGANAMPAEYITSYGQSLLDQDNREATTTLREGVRDQIKLLKLDRPDMTIRDIAGRVGCSKSLVAKVLKAA